jgi:hypothetical protein
VRRGVPPVLVVLTGQGRLGGAPLLYAIGAGVLVAHVWIGIAAVVLAHAIAVLTGGASSTQPVDLEPVAAGG